MSHAATPLVSVAGHDVHGAFGKLARYAVTCSDTVERYDLGNLGDPDIVSEDEVVRTRVINSRIGHQDLEHLLRISAETTNLLAGIPITAHLRDADPAIPGGLYDQALAVFDRYLTPGIQWGKVSKVLHLKRPHLYPILDSRVEQAYRQPAEKATVRYPQRGYRRMYWAAVRDDLVTPTNVIAPDQPALTALAEKWQAAEQARDPAVIAAAIEDRSVPNLSSICLLVTHGGGTVLLTGDARGDHVLSGLASGGFLGDGPLLTDVLKLPHHGSVKNVSPEFFRRIHASHYVISTDGRKHPHPDPQTLTWLVESRSSADHYTIHFTNPLPAVNGHLEELRKGRSFETNLLQGRKAVIKLGAPAE